jgi:multiple sugar transport system permease protein
MRKNIHNYDPLGPQKKLALFFIAPWVIGFLGFSVYPILYTLFLSFTEYSLFSAPKLIGLNNYLGMFKDVYFYAAIKNSFYFVFVGVSLQMIFAIFLAILLNSKVKAQGLFRTIYYIPTLVPPVAGALIWVWILNPQYGLINGWLRMLHLPEPLWFSSAFWSKPGIILIVLWGIGNVMVVFLAGVSDIPMMYYEAIEIDGGGAFAKFRHITFPMLTPLILFQLINAIIAGFNMFTQSYVVSLTAGRLQGSIGGVENSLLFYAPNLYREAFTRLKFGYASAQAWFMLIIVLTFTLIILKTSKYWVYYRGE